VETPFGHGLGGRIVGRPKPLARSAALDANIASSPMVKRDLDMRNLLDPWIAARMVPPRVASKISNAGTYVRRLRREARRKKGG
jgi:hypothetical protein